MITICIANSSLNDDVTLCKLYIQPHIKLNTVKYFKCCRKRIIPPEAAL